MKIEIGNELKRRTILFCHKFATSVNWDTFHQSGGRCGSASNSEFGFNIGAGADFNLSEKFVINAELKYKVGGDWSRLLISAGVAYKF